MSSFAFAGRKTRTAAAALMTCAGLAAVGASPAHAIPDMQLYVEGAAYDASSETWIGTPGTDNLLRLWLILADDSKADTNLVYQNVRLSVVFPTPLGGGDRPIVLTPAFLGGTAANTFLGFNGSGLGPAATRNLHIATDGNPDNGAFVAVDEAGKKDTPLIDAKTSLPSHDEYVDGVTWQEYVLGNIDMANLGSLGLGLVDIADFNGSGTPAPDAGKKGVILAYDIDVTAFVPIDSWHFDAYAVLDTQTSKVTELTQTVCTTDSKGRTKCKEEKTGTTTTTEHKFSAVSNPFSHDAGGNGGTLPPVPTDVPVGVPEPGTLGLLGLGFVGLMIARRRAA